jgi:hypothetical protein
MTVTNGYIEKTGFKILKNFLGCFPSDLQPKTRKENFSIVFNLSKHDEEGTHFVAIYTNKTELIYFDSFGKPMENVLLKNFVKKHIKKKKYSFNNTKIQHDQSSFCGIFCLSFLTSMENKQTLKKFISNFNLTHLEKNDKTCTNVLKTMILYSK